MSSTDTPKIDPGDLADSTVEIQSPAGLTNIHIPARWTVHDIAKLAETLQAAGYVHAKPRTSSAILAFMPKPQVVGRQRS